MLQLLRPCPVVSVRLHQSFLQKGPREMSTVMSNPEDGRKASSMHDFQALDIDGNVVNLREKYSGHPCIVVNVATKCGLTDSNYSQLQKLFEKYSGDDQTGLRILAFPCNQFGGQESGSEEEIKNFAKSKYNVAFDLFAKIKVNGSEEHPLYTFLKSKQQGILVDAIKWNFTKFVVDGEGVPVARFGPKEEPIPKVEEKIKEMINTQ